VHTQLTWRVALSLSASLLAGCGAASSSTLPHTSGQTPSPQALPRIELPVDDGQTVEGLVDVAGHDIYARCAGQGSPTVVYFTGWAPDPNKLGVSAIQAIETVDAGEHRICSYERRNTGRSETVKGTQSPEDIVADVDGVLHALGERGPFVLLGASFGGLVAGAYAVAHPDRTAGILLLDSSIPDDYPIDERHGFTGACLEANRQADAWDSLEKIDNCRLAKWAYDRRDREPDVPLVYLAAEDATDREPVTDDPFRKAFVSRWSPGIWKTVDAPHWMDEADPGLVVRNLERVIVLAHRASALGRP
jgi:pimeloyl-ACP methyl ester carboxylesterase